MNVSGNEKYIFVALDHGISMGQIDGLEDMRATLRKILEGPVHYIVINKGNFRRNRDILAGAKCFINLSAAYGDSLDKVLVGTPEEVRDLGAYGVSVHLNLGNEHQSGMLKDLGAVSARCAALELPLLVMMYHRSYGGDGRIVERRDVKTLQHLCTVAAELGGDFVKIATPDRITDLLEVTRCCPIPVLIAGGSKSSSKEILHIVKEAVVAGASGVSFGRNIFQNDDIPSILKSIDGTLSERAHNA